MTPAANVAEVLVSVPVPLLNRSCRAYLCCAEAVAARFWDLYLRLGKVSGGCHCYCHP